jgi:hypothetical protein
LAAVEAQDTVSSSLYWQQLAGQDTVSNALYWQQFEA